ncbi:hypothetical protein CDAR_191801 [Caerostris darwini]|uniref:Uncharacterized protein n=1 Tax=Caerostris darwini TaxID=1538125 RepID=A0AAV4PC53_9ARAC|nr:hypothetical protein CDAR_191801 [Caerostris darwini]
MNRFLFVFLIIVCCLTVFPVLGHDDGSHSGESLDHFSSNESESSGRKKHISIFTVDFSHISTPFIISLWIAIACLAKIGKCSPLCLTQPTQNTLKIVTFAFYSILTLHLYSVHEV